VVAGITTGSASREVLAAAGAPHILDSITGLVQLVGIAAGAHGNQG
jgi:phosphoglycolate phosphatase-like HAD superfamily hydrolase